MELSVTDRILWITGFSGNIVLLAVLLVKSRWKVFPLFTSLIGFNTLRTILLYGIFQYGDENLYAKAYWSAEAFDLILQLGLIYEMARIVLKPAGIWLRDARKMFLLYGVIGALVAAGLVFAANPKLPTTFIDWNEKAQLFTIMLVCVFFAGMMVASSQLGLVWRNHVMGLGRGFTAWAIVSLLTEAMHTYFGPQWHEELLNHIIMLAYLAAVIYWIITLWRSEPKNRTLSPEMNFYLSKLQKQTEGWTRQGR